LSRDRWHGGEDDLAESRALRASPERNESPER